MSCPACGSNNVSYDDCVTVCESCGTVIDEVVFQHNDFSLTQTNTEFLEPNILAVAGKHKSAMNNIDRIATYFSIPKDLAAQAKQLIKEHNDDLPNRTPLETALFVTYFAAREWLSPWSIADFVEKFPIPVDISRVQRVNFIFAQKSRMYKNVQFESSENEAAKFLDTIIPGIKKQYGGSHKMSKSTITQLKKRTKSLIALADLYGLNAGRKSRPTIIAAAIISHASLQIHNQSSKTNTKPYKKVSLYHDRRLDCLSKYCSFGTRVIKIRMFEYAEFLEACAKNVPWISKPKKQFVHYYLQDILDLYGPRNGAAAPHFKLSDDQYSIPRIKKNAALTKEFEALLISVQQHIDNETIPQDKQSLIHSIYHLMTFGLTKEDFVNWTKGAIRGMADSLQFRAKYGTDRNLESDMNRPELDHNDMLDREVEVYIK